MQEYVKNRYKWPLGRDPKTWFKKKGANGEMKRTCWEAESAKSGGGAQKRKWGKQKRGFYSDQMNRHPKRCTSQAKKGDGAKKKKAKGNGKGGIRASVKKSTKTGDDQKATCHSKGSETQEGDWEKKNHDGSSGSGNSGKIGSERDQTTTET